MENGTAKMSDDQSHNLAKLKAAQLLKKRAPSVASGLSVGTDHQTRKQRGYASSVGTVSFVGQPQEGEFECPALKYENTFRMEPRVRFPVPAITNILELVLDTLQDKTYDADECKTMTKTISDNIKASVKALSIPRYKIICLVHIGELNNQGLRISSRCLWNDHFDTFASHEFKNHSLFAVACVYGVYYE